MQYRYVALLIIIAFIAGTFVQGNYGIAGRLLTEIGVRNWLVRYGYLPPKPPAYQKLPKMTEMEPVELPCPKKQVLTLVITGQSNADGVAPDSPNRRYNDIYVLHNGRCFQASDPAPGWGLRGAIWTTLAERVLQIRGPILLARAIGEATIEHFAPGGSSHLAVQKVIHELQIQGLKPDAILFQGGESDAKRGTPTAYFTSYLDKFVASLNGIPVYVARASLCGGAFSDSVRSAQKKYPGPDTDKIFGGYRYDGCHFNDAGRRKAADAWFNVLKETGLLEINSN